MQAKCICVQVHVVMYVRLYWVEMDWIGREVQIVLKWLDFTCISRVGLD